MTFTIYFSNNQYIEIPDDIANESDVIRYLIEDTNDRFLTISTNIDLDESDIKLFLESYSEIKRNNKLFTICDLLSFVKVADYFEYSNVSIYKYSKIFFLTKGFKRVVHPWEYVNLTDYLLQKIVAFLISIKEGKELTLIKEKCSRLPITLKLHMSQMIRSLKMSIPSIRCDTSESYIQRMSLFRSPLITQSISLTGYGKYQSLKCEGILSDELPTKEFCIFKDFRKSLNGSYQFHNMYFLSNIDYLNHHYKLNSASICKSTSQWLTSSVSNNHIEITLDSILPLIEISKWVSYYKNNLYLNELSINGSHIIINVEGKNVKKETKLKYSLSNFSATKYNTYIFGKTAELKGPLHDDYLRTTPWQIADVDDSEFYSSERKYDMIVIIDLLSDAEIFNLIIPQGESYGINDTGKYFLLISSSRQLIELYHIRKKVRILKKHLKELFKNGLDDQSEFILDSFNRLIIVSTSSGLITINFDGLIRRYQLLDTSRIKLICPIKNCLLTLEKNDICFRDPITLDHCHSFTQIWKNQSMNKGCSLLDDPFIRILKETSLSSLRERVIVSPKGENFILILNSLYHIRLYPISDDDYQNLESLLNFS